MAGLPQPSINIQIGTVVDGRYELTGKLGAGGFAAVFRGRHTQLGREVAIKVLDQRLGRDDPHFNERFLREAQTAARMAHPNIVTIYDFGYAGPGQPYIAMELCEGHDLRAELTTTGPMRPGRAFRLFSEVLDALSTGHGLGVVHKDLKPANLFVQGPGTKRESLKILDFGVARVDYHELQELDPEEGVFGTPRYLAPEYITDRVVTPAIDVYQMALIICETLTGLPVVDGDSHAVMMKHAHGELEIPIELQYGRIGHVFKRALALDYNARYPDAGAFLEAFRSIEDDFCRLPPMARGVWATEVIDQTIPIKLDFSTASIPAASDATQADGLTAAADDTGRSNPHIPARGTWPPMEGGSGPHPAMRDPVSSVPNALAFHPQQAPEGGGKGRALLLVLLVLLVGAGGFAAWMFVIKPKMDPPPKSAAAAETPETKEQPEEVPEVGTAPREGISFANESERVDFAVTSTPSGAEVKVDGDSWGITPITLNLPKGSLVQIVVEFPDHETYASTVDIPEADADRKLHVDLVAEPGAVTKDTGRKTNGGKKDGGKKVGGKKDDGKKDGGKKDTGDSGGGGFIVAP